MGYIIDCIMSDKPIDMVRFIKTQRIEEKKAFDNDFMEKVKTLLVSKADNPKLVNWAKAQIKNNFEILSRREIYKYWIEVEYARLNLILEYKSLLKLQKDVNAK